MQYALFIIIIIIIQFNINIIIFYSFFPSLWNISMMSIDSYQFKLEKLRWVFEIWEQKKTLSKLGKGEVKT